MPNWGADLSGIDFDNIKYFVRSTEKQAATLGRPARGHQEHLRQARHPGGREAAPGRPASPRSTSPRSSTTRSARTWRSRASSSWTPTPALREHPELFKEYFGTVIPAGDNKFSALNTAVWSGGSFIYVPQGRARRHPAAGLLPDQHREHGPVRADADHRRRGRLRALRRGLHRADLQVGLAALGGGRDHREEGRAAAATRPSRTGRTTSTTWSPSGPRPRRARPWSGSTATSAPR